jgi:hypothetical protein
MAEFQRRFAKRTGETQLSTEKPSTWIEKNFYVPEPRDVITGAVLPPGPIRLAEHQRRIVNEALSCTEDGLLRYSTVIYSAPKKSGKSALGAAVTLYFAHHTPDAYVYCLANDGKGSRDRIYGPIYKCFRLHRQLGGIFSEIHPQLVEATLPNYSKIEALPCDAAGEAGAEPTFTCWSELWGFDTERKIRLWTELTIPPTKYGRAMRWVESYAGFTGVSILLEALYDEGVRNGTPHPDFPDLPVYVNEAAGIFCYWDHEPRMVWQTPEYYASEAKMHSDSEFRRVHKNEWVEPVGAFIQKEWWESCQDTSIGPLEDTKTPVILAMDAAVTRDCAAIVAVTRDPVYPETDVAVRDCKIFSPKDLGGQINLSDTLGQTFIEWCLRGWNIVCVAYDSYQLEKLVQDFRKGIVGLTHDQVKDMDKEELDAHLHKLGKLVRRWFYQFGQQAPRAVADKQLHDMIVGRQIHWNPQQMDTDIPLRGDFETLYKHITQAGASETGDKFRLQKLHDKAKIDGAVALSMATERCLALTVGNAELNMNRLGEKLMRGEITYEQFEAQMQRRRRIYNVKDLPNDY